MALLDEVRCAVLSKPNAPPDFGRMIIKDSFSDCDRSPQRVQVATLDQLLPTFRRLGIKKAIIKIDIEGSEPKAMLGGSKLLEEIDVPFVQMEFDKVKEQLFMGSGTDKKSAEKFMEMMKNLQYVVGPMSSDWNRTILDWNDVGRWPNDVLWYKKQRTIA